MSVTVKTAPDPHDVTEFRFQALRRVRLGDKTELSGRHGGLVAVAGRSGLVLVAGVKCVYIVKTQDIEQQDKISNKQERAVENTSVNKVRIKNTLKSSVYHQHDIMIDSST